MKGCLYRVVSLAAWGVIFAINLSAALVYAGADSLMWRWLALAAAASAGCLILVAGRNQHFARALTILSQGAWLESYEKDYRQTTGFYSGAVVAGLFTLLLTLAGMVGLLVDT